MKKIFLILIVIMSLLFFSCAKKKKDTQNITQEKSEGGSQYTLVFTHGSPPDPDATNQKAALFLEKFVEQKTQGRIEVVIYPFAQLGDGPDILPQLVNGTISATLQAMRMFGGFFPELQVFEIPYTFADVQLASAFLESPMVDYVNNKIQQKFPDIEVSGLAFFGYRQWLMNKPINTLADLRGIKIRSIPSPLHDLFYKDMGMLPISIAMPDVYTALSTKLVGGLDQPFSDSIPPRHDDFVKYAYVDNNIFHSTVWMLSKKWFNTLPDDLKPIVMDGLDRARIVFKETVLAIEDKYIKQFEKNGGTVQYLQDSDIPRTKEESTKILNWFLKEYGEAGQEALDAVNENLKWAHTHKVTKTLEWAMNY